MNPLLKRVKNVTGEVCVSVILNTHRTRPDNQQDIILLKNLVKEAEERLLNEYDKRYIEPVIKNLNSIVAGIDHNHNLESLILFASHDFADYTRLPVDVKDRVVIDESFATRDLVRAMHQESAYYILVLSRQNARLIEAFNDKVVEEIDGKFPIKNSLYTTDKLKLSMVDGQDNMIEEFFNRVDKTVWEVTKDHTLPIVLATESRNFDHYFKVSDRKDLILGHINRGRDDDKAHHIVAEAWTLVLDLIKTRNEARMSDLRSAVTSGKFVSDYNDILKAIREGRGKTLFVRKGYFQPAILENDVIQLIENRGNNMKNVIDDINDELIEMNMAFGGDTVFIDNDEMDLFERIALITRY
jgi:hypothetical protein